jgi:hypothetical protein
MSLNRIFIFFLRKHTKIRKIVYFKIIFDNHPDYERNVNISSAVIVWMILCLLKSSGHLVPSFSNHTYNFFNLSPSSLFAFLI